MALNDSNENIQNEEDTEANRNKLKAGKKRSSKQKVTTTLVCLSSSTSTPTVEQSYINDALVPIVPHAMSSMATYYQTFGHPSIIQDWSPIMSTIQTPNPIYTLPFQPLPVTICTQPVINTPTCPHSCAVFPQIMPPILMQPIVTEVPVVTDYAYESMSYYTTPTFSNDLNDDDAYNTIEEQNVYEQINTSQENENEDGTVYNTTIEQTISTDDYQDDQNITHYDPLESYLSLPKDLFPTPNMVPINPNPLIDAFCKLENHYYHTPWLLDLEFGLPKAPTTRPLPTYDVKFNSIHCKNSPNAIHPGFECCNQEFKTALLFYYDSIVSSWYKGFVCLNRDISVENFQSWLLLPMHALGMCWP